MCVCGAIVFICFDPDPAVALGPRSELASFDMVVKELMFQASFECIAVTSRIPTEADSGSYWVRQAASGAYCSLNCWI